MSPNRSELDAGCLHALRIAGPLDHGVFSFSAWFFGLGLDYPDPVPLAQYTWPRYQPMLRPIRDAIYIQPLIREIEAAAAEQVDEETLADFGDALKRHIDEGEAILEEPANE